MFPDSRVRAPKTAIVITAKTTPYSAIVCPSSRDWSAAKSFCTCFTSLLVLGRRSGAAEDDTPMEKEKRLPSRLEPLCCLATLRSLTPNYLPFESLWRGRAAYGLRWPIHRARRGRRLSPEIVIGASCSPIWGSGGLV